MRLQLEPTTVRGRLLARGSMLVAAIALGAVTVGAGVAGADSGWSRTPGSGLAGGSIRVASSSTTLCQWIQPAGTGAPVDPPTTAPGDTATTAPAAAATDGDVVYDGTQVDVRLTRTGVDVPVGTLPVTTGGAWSGRLTIPTDNLPPGDYDLVVKCVVDRPELDGLRTYDFDPMPFTLTEGPPPTTVEIPTEIPPPLTAVNPVQVQGAQLDRPAATTSVPASSAPAATTPTAAAATLPKTGDGTVGIAIAGIGALLVGGVALWWGARRTHRAPADLLD